MGENESWHEPGELLPNGLLPEASPVMQALHTERWSRAEGRTAELIACIQPNQLAEVQRNAVADYVQQLIMKCFPCQVCTFGSVPLKTYLPDGDIDLTVFSHDQNLKDTWANLVCDMLESEEKNENAEFHVKEVQYIQAEVKIIKCLVENIVVDISFNQVGGLCTLCFLDEVDNIISQNHLFKRSIVLVKAWCYYESRILGAHHGLISTYALETLVLYIFRVFNNSFQGPLEVLYRFLEFFSKFDWDNFCVSLWGPVPISSLPDVTADPPRKDSGELLLSKLFLEACCSVYAVFPGGQENNGQPFVSKHFNVIDPLRVNNNLGRSVSKGNFFRIRSAFAFGAKRLARLLDCPNENLISEVNQFFTNTWERHGSGRRLDTARGDIMRKRLSTLDVHDFGNSIDIGGNNVNQNSVVCEKEDKGIRGHGVSPKHGRISAKMMPMTSELSAAYHIENLKSPNLNTLWVTDQMGRENVSVRALHSHGIQKDLKADHLVNDTQGQFLFARNHSTPELTDAYGNVSSQSWLNRRAEASYTNGTSAKMDTDSRKQNHGSESLGRFINHSLIEDTSSVRNASSQQSVDVTANEFSCVLNSCHRDLGCDDRSGDVYAEERSASSKFSSAALSNSLRSRTSDSSWDGSSTKSSGEEQGKKIASVDQAASHGKGKIMSEHVLNRTEDNEQKCAILSNMKTEMIKRHPEHESVVSLEVPRHHMPGLEAVQRNGMDSMIPLTPMLIDPGPRQRINDNSGLVAFYPAGPPIPFLVLPVYDVPSEKGNSDLSSGHCGHDATLKNSESIHCPLEYNHYPSNSLRESSAAKTSESQTPDIFNSDFARHWQNLQFGRFCQDPQHHGSLLSSPVMVPPAYLQGRFPYDNPGRILSTNANISSQLMTSYGHRLAPVAPLQSVSGRPLNMYQLYVDEMARSRSGTGTYLPNPVYVTEGHSTGTRRGNYNHDWNGEREGNWNANSKSLSAGRIHSRNQNDRLNLRSDRPDNVWNYT